MTPLQRTEIEKVATDSGYDRIAAEVGGWLILRSSHFAEAVALVRLPDGRMVVAVENVIRSQDVMTLPCAGEVPIGLVSPSPFSNSAILGLNDRRDLAEILAFIAREALQRRDNPLAIFQAKIRGLPSATEVERITIQRVGQDVFRASLIEYWGGACAITGCAIQDLLRASHIKPWADCESDAERLDPLNGLLLSPAWDAAFDKGFVTFTVDGMVVPSPEFSAKDQEALGIRTGSKVQGGLKGSEKYLSYHREHVYRDGG